MDHCISNTCERGGPRASSRKRAAPGVFASCISMPGACAVVGLIAAATTSEAWISPSVLQTSTAMWHHSCRELRMKQSVLPPGHVLHKEKWQPPLTSMINSGKALFGGQNLPTRVRVVTDIDDTIKSSGNLRLGNIPLGGIDSQYERGEFYPGVFQFSFELANHNVPYGDTPLNVAVLTARARELLWALELKTSHPVVQSFQECGIENGVSDWGLGPVHYGSAKEWVCQVWKPHRKFKNFQRVLNGHFGETFGYAPKYVFIGDIGEGDVGAAEMMVDSYPEHMAAVFLHVVSPTPYYAMPADRVIKGVPIIYFRTYVGAARKAVEIGLMTTAAMKRVIKLAKRQLKDVPLESSKWKDVKADIEDAKALLVKPPMKVWWSEVLGDTLGSTLFPTGAGISTPSSSTNIPDVKDVAR